MTREDLLRPIVQRLQSQASSGNPAPIVSIYGAVRLPGQYPLLSSEENFQSLIAMAGGMKDGAFLGNVELKRREMDQNRAKTVIESLDLTQNRSFEVQASDEFRINFVPGWRSVEMATVSGKLNFPVNTY